VFACVDFFQKHCNVVSLYELISWCITLFHILYIEEDEGLEFIGYCSKLKLDERINKLGT
jgi:hypothetical protein